MQFIGKLMREIDPDPTRRAHATAERMLERYGVVTRGAAMSERTAGGFAAVYKVLSAFEESGRSAYDPGPFILAFAPGVLLLGRAPRA
jgi:ribosomal 50S subunit-associated protein YjgA (DUF615 family)